MTKKWLAVILSTVLTIGTLAGCGSNSDTSSDTKASTQSQGKEETDTSQEIGGATAKESAPITIDFWNSWTGPDGDILVAQVERFNKENPWGITINMDISSSFAEKLSTALPTGEASPLILLGAGDRYKYQDYLLPLDDIWENTSLQESDFNGNSLDPCYIDSSLYGIPFQNSVYYMYWNKELFREAGLDPEAPPASFEEWTEMAAIITDPDKNIYGSGLFMSYGNQQMCLMQQKGGAAVTSEGNGTFKVNFAGNEGYKEYLQWEKELYDKEYNPLENEIGSMFKAGQIGILVNGPWLAAGATASGIDYGMCKIFGQEPLGDVAGFFITSSATEEEKLACERFIQWWYTGNEGTDIADTACSIWSLELGFPTVYIPTAECSAYQTNERLAALSLNDNSKESIWIVTSPDFSGWAEVVTVVGDMSQAVIYGTSIDDAIVQAQENAEKIVKQYVGEDALVQ